MKRILIALVLVLLFSSSTYAGITGTKSFVNDKQKVIIFVGDSRAKQMSKLRAKNRRNYVVVYSSGGTIDSINPFGGDRWIGNKLRKVLQKYPTAPVVFALGVNGNADPCTNFQRTVVYDYYIRSFPKHRYIISTVGGTGSISGAYSNSNVVKFNVLLRQKYANSSSVVLYDCYEFLEDSRLLCPGKNNKGTRDGLHYKSKVYKALLKDLREFVEEI